MKTAVVLAVAVLANSFGNLCLSIGMKQIGTARPLGVAWLLGTGFHVVSNGWMILGVVLLLIFLAAYLTALSWADLSFVLPATAPAYLINAGLSKFFLHESVSLTRWAGTVLIVTGTWLVARTYTSAPSSPPATTPEPKEIASHGNRLDSPPGIPARPAPGGGISARSGS
jgi:drug/metabolite transporter (DMT)-like permease